MTGFGKGEAETGNWKVNVMIRSLNGRGLDVSLRAPSFLMPIELKVKEIIKDNLRRGTLHVVVDVESKKVMPPIDIEKLTENVGMLQNLSSKLGLSVSDDLIFELSWKYSEKVTVELDEELERTILNAVYRALEELIESRRREGEALREDFLKRIDRISDLISDIEKLKHDVVDKLKERVIERAKRLDLPDEHPTILNEIMFLLEKMDVEEEVTRFKTHLDRFRKLLDEDRDVGKKLEFLAQEMHREITTLGNKIPDLSEYVVEIKAEIDRIKQQAANVE